MTKLIIRTVFFGLILSVAAATTAEAKSPDLDTVEIRADLVQAHAKTQTSKTKKVEQLRQTELRRTLRFDGNSGTTIMVVPMGSTGNLVAGLKAATLIRNMQRKTAIENAWARVTLSQQLALMKKAVDMVMGKTAQPTTIATINPDEL